MNFTLRERTKAEIESINNEHRIYSRMVKGDNYIDVCPYEIIIGNEKKEVWDLTDKEIIDLTQDTMEDFAAYKLRLESGSKEKNCPKLIDLSKVLSIWKKKNTASINLIEEYFHFKEKTFKSYASVIDDLFTPIVKDKVEQAKIIADYLHGMKDGEQTTSENIIKILYNQEQIAAKKKQGNINV